MVRLDEKITGLRPLDVISTACSYEDYRATPLGCGTDAFFYEDYRATPLGRSGL